MSDASMPGHDLPHGDEPGAGSTPNDDGEGTVGLADRLDDGAPAANQGKVEPVPPTPAHTDPEGSSGGLTAEGLDLDQMSLGAGDAQMPSHPAGAARPDHPSTTVEEVGESGTAQRAPMSQGVAPEPVGTDRDTSAARMTGLDAGGTGPTSSDSPGAAHRVPVASHDSAQGTSEAAGIVHGARTPQQ